MVVLLVVLLLVVVVVGVVVVGTVPVGVVMGILSSRFSVVLEWMVEGLADDLRASSSKPSGGSGIRVSQSWSLPP